LQASFAAHLVLEMLDRVGDENFGARNPRFHKCPVENASGWTDERPAGQVFLVAGLLADQHQPCVPAPFARYGLRRILIERATLAFVLGLGELPQRSDRRRRIEVELQVLSHGTLQRMPPPPIH
jgi:hypothetical protein